MSWHMGAPSDEVAPPPTSSEHVNPNLNPNHNQVPPLSAQWNQGYHPNQQTHWYHPQQTFQPIALSASPSLQSRQQQPPPPSANWINPSEYYKQANVPTSSVNNHQQMTSQYFDKTSTQANQDGWGDEWGDFNDDSNNIVNNTTAYSSAVPFTSPIQNANYSQPIQQYGGVANQYSNNNQGPPQMQQRPPTTGYQHAGYPPPPSNYPPQTQSPYNSELAYQKHPTNAYPSTQQPQHQPPPPTADHDNWNWTAEAKPLENVDNMFPKVSPAAVQKHATSPDDIKSEPVVATATSYNASYSNITNNNLQSRQPDDFKNTQSNIQNPLLSRVKRSEHLLTPQWSTESQVSQTSSDRSIESDNIDTRSSATNTSDDQGYGQQPHSNYSTDLENNQNVNFRHGAVNTSYAELNQANYAPSQPQGMMPVVQEKTAGGDTDLDSLDQALMKMDAVKTEAANNMNYYQQDVNVKAIDLQQNALQQPQHHNILPYNVVQPPVVQPPQLQNNIASPGPIKSEISNAMYGYPPQSSTPNPVPPSISPALPQQAQYVAPPKLATPPQTMQQPPPPQQHQKIPTHPNMPPTVNPFKRNAAAPVVNRNLPYLSVTPSVPPIAVLPATGFYPNPLPNQEILNVPPENSENLEVENLEIAPSNDRNQYLQTGHLSEEGQIGDGSEITTAPHESSDNLPPPGLSRFVLGQQGSENQPPRGLDRMIPGGTELNMELTVGRQADGQASNIAPPPGPRISERNLYPVPGESVIQSQRVIPGVEGGDRRSSQISMQQQHQQQQNNEPEILINEQYREVNVEGENVADNQNAAAAAAFQLHQNEIREEPIEGANTQDEIIPQVNLNQVETESNLTFDGGRKDLSNPSTANDDSDKEHLYYKSRRGGPDETSSRRRGSNKARGRYDTEDTDYNSDRERRRYVREGSSRDVRDHRERDRDSKEKDPRDRREGSGRDRDKNERDRYDRDRYKYRSETESSKYENDSRDGKRKYDRDEYDRRRRDDHDREDRRYRKGDRPERSSDDRRRDDRGKYRGGDDRRRDRGGDRSKYEYEEDYHHRSGSRNALDRDAAERDRRYPQGYYSGGYGQYDPYTYYQQQQQYYESLRRTNPQAYMEMYKKYFSQMQQQVPGADVLNTDGRESVHSGRSSANEKDRYNRSSSMHQYYHHPPASTTPNSQIVNSTAYIDASYNMSGLSQQSSFLIPGSQSRAYYTQSDFSDLRNDQNDASLSHGGAASVTQSQRLTPCKFNNDHAVASISSGLMVCLKPNRYLSANSQGSILKILTLGANDGTRRLFNSFPGPLIRGVTHKKTVIEFCEDQIRYGPVSAVVRSRGNSVSSIHSAMSQPNKSSFVLMWNLLILLLRQNGMVVGTDIAELLLLNQVEYPYDITSSKPNTASVSGRNSVISETRPSRQNEDEDEVEGDELRTSSEEKELVENNNKKQLSEEEVTSKFRNYLLYGNVGQALDWATDNNLWGHALFLASKMDRRTHADIMMKFANKLSLNDPLQTLFQLMSGRIPSAVTSVQDEKWGDWRSHLAMILSNTSQKPDLDRKAITTLGDSLYNRGDLFGAQFCYLMAQVGFGKYSTVNQETALMFNSHQTVRLILLGSSHHKGFFDFATNESIMMTEIYEYACTLNDEKFSISEFQPYKYLLATRMVDYGFYMKTLMYMEQITKHIELDSSKYTSDFLEKVFVLGDRLKYYDPGLEKTMDELNNSAYEQGNVSAIDDQKWLQNLKTIIMSANQYRRPSVDAVPSYDSMGSVAQADQYNQDYMKTQIDQQFVEITQKFNDLNMQYAPPQTSEELTAAGNNYGVGGYQQNSQAPSMIPTVNTTENVTGYNQGGMQYYDQSQQQQPLYEQPSEMQHIPEHQTGHENAEHYGGAPQQQQQHQVYSGQPDNGIPNQTYDYWSQMNAEIPKPTISMPNSMSTKPGFYEESPTSEASGSNSNSENVNPNKGASKNDTAQSKSKSQGKELKNGGLSGPNNANSGWFGGIWNKLSLKPKNQMILPDDKNPTIVWDPETKKWVNTDGSEEATAAFKPPPKMAELPHMNPPQSSAFNAPPVMSPHEQLHPSISAQQQHNPPTYQPFSSNPPLGDHHGINDPAAAAMNAVPSGEALNKIPNLQSNMFKMQRNRTLKKSYVDVFNPSGAPAKAIENVPPPLSQLPPVPQGGFLIPGAQPASLGNDGAQQFYNPNQFAVYQQQQ